MKPTNDKRPGLVYLLIILLVLLGLGGLGGGAAMFLDPGGTSMGLPAGLLDDLPINNFILPGVFLVSVMGLLPLAIAWGVWTRQTWAWLAAVVQSVLLILWIGYQILLWGSPILLQVVYLIWGFVLLGLCYSPTVRQYLQVKPVPK